VVIPGRIQANGGKGGDGGVQGAAGGGGSGGCILIQASGTISVALDHLEVRGGAAGSAGGQNSSPGAGDGGEGWIRLEEGAGEELPVSGISRVFLPGFGPGSGALSHFLVPGFPVLRLSGDSREITSAFLLWEGAGPGLDVYGAPGPLAGMVDDVPDLEHLEYLRCTVRILSRMNSPGFPITTEVDLPYLLGSQ
jgi:hypothetical protein